MIRLGRRGAFLALFGAMYVVIGYSYTGDRPTQNVRDALRLATDLVPLNWCGAVWIFAGVVGLVSSLLPLGRDWPGFVAEIGMPTIWGALYFIGWANGDSTRGWTSAAIFAIVAVAVAVVAGMVDPSDLSGGKR